MTMKKRRPVILKDWDKLVVLLPQGEVIIRVLNVTTIITNPYDGYKVQELSPTKNNKTNIVIARNVRE